jgi:transcriptional regulator with XRE-family HTH domain
MKYKWDGDRLKELRAMKGLSMKDAAKLIGSSEGLWKRWEMKSFTPSGIKLIKLVNTFDVSPMFLFTVET